MKKLLLFLLILMLCINIAYSDCVDVSETLVVCKIDQPMAKVAPIINLNYTDDINPQPLDLNSLKFKLLDNSSVEIPVSYVYGNYDDDPNKPYINYTPSQNLAASNYTLNSSVAKQGGLLGTTMVYFTIYFPPVDITLLQPENGVSGVSPYTVKIWTTSYASGVYANCKYHPNDFYSYTTMTQEFTPNAEHTEHTITVTGNQNLYIRCKDQYDNSDNIKLIQTTYTSDAPSILAIADPMVIIEETDGQLQTTLYVTRTSGPDFQCKYSPSQPVGDTSQAKYDSMTAFTDTSFKSTHSQAVSGFTDKQSYTYYIMCKGQNGLYSNVAPASFSTDTTVALALTVTTPTYFSTTDATLNVSTNKLASCNFYNRTRVFTTTSNLKKHSYQLAGLSSGSYTYYANCTKGSEKTAESQITFSLDTTPPSKPVVNDDSNITGVDSGYTWKTNELKARWSSFDNETGIAEYQYSIENPNGTAIVSFTSAGTSTSITATDLSLIAGTYKFKVKARNAANLWSEIGISDGIIVDPTKKPLGDVTPPIGTVTKRTLANRIEVTLTCSDSGGSGCNTKFYGLSAIGQQCSSIIAYTTPVNITTSSLFCWQLTDNAGNVARDNETIIFTSGSQPSANCTVGGSCTRDDLCAGTYDSGCGCVDTPNDNCPVLQTPCRDTDKDNYGVGCVKGLDCDDTNPSLTTKCPSGCLIDNDGDGYGLGCEKGFDCDDFDKLVQQNCTSGCLIDSDGDGYGLGCSKGLDCDDTSALAYNDCLSGCIQDSDTDGYGLGCSNGADCDDTNKNLHDKCEITGCTQDNDGDGYGTGCTKGADCDDTTNLLNKDCSATTGCTQDNDGDDYGTGCTKGADCDDLDPASHESCDKDKDGMTDEFELANKLDPDDPEDANLDNDNDGLTNKEEYELKAEYGQSTDPNNKDTDGDGYSDKEEIALQFSPVDKEIHPKSPWIKITLISLGSIALLGGVGYFGYGLYLSKQAVKQAPAKAVFAAHKIDQVQQKPVEELKKKKSSINQEQRRRIFSAFEEKPQQEGSGIKQIRQVNKFKTLSEAINAKQGQEQSSENEDIFKKLPGSEPDIFSKLSKISKKEEPKTKKDKKGDIFDTLSNLKK